MEELEKSLGSLGVGIVTVLVAGLIPSVALAATIVGAALILKMGLKVQVIPKEK